MTIFLVLANVLCFYIWQYADKDNQTTLFDHYFYSGQFRIEAEQYLKFSDSKVELTERDFKQFTPKSQEVFNELLQNAEFQRKLDRDQIIKPGDAVYNEWRPLRDKYLWLFDRVVSYKYALNPSQPTPLTYFTHMFLHGDAMHLYGNMVFLFLMGFVVEIIFGRFVYLLGYLLSGLISGYAYMLLFSDQNTWGIGASGAIAGVMGMYIVLFGLRKIRFFYYLFVYFDYVRAPAVIILPFYILYQLFIEFYLDTNINVTAHLGGLAGGMLYAAIAKRLHPSINTAYVEENTREDDYKNQFQEAQSMLAAMKVDEAKSLFEKILQKHPDDINTQQQLFTIARYNPASEAYHNYAHKLMNLSGSDKSTVKVIHDTFNDYASNARPKPRWTPDLLLNIAIKFASCGYMDNAEKLVNHLVKAMPGFTRNPEGLSALVKYFNGVNKQKMQHYQKLLLELYPHSPQATHYQK